MKKLYDVTTTIEETMVMYPGDPKPVIDRLHKIADRASANVSRLSFGAHTGTHLDAPYHYFETGKSLDQFPPEVLVGPCIVCDTGEADVITEELLDRFPLAGHVRVIFKTKNSRLSKRAPEKFREEYVYISADAAARLVSLEVRIVGLDYLSIDNYRDKSAPAHNALLGKGVLLIENLDLSQVPPGEYELICAPLKIKNSDGAPARVFLREL